MSQTTANEIQADIKNGVFDNWPKLKKKLDRLSVKLMIINSDLTNSELTLLKENDY